MHWILNFSLFLFDFDGLLVNTEKLHREAYIRMLANEGLALDWSFQKYCELAHSNDTALKEALYDQFPTLDPDWKRLYQQKKEIYQNLLRAGKIELMPGVPELLSALQTTDIRRCVVTHSSRDQTNLIRAQLSILNTIPHWITREDYTQAKPHPEGYLRAIELYGQPGDRIIGFEDSFRGLTALEQTPALPILICSSNHPLIDKARGGRTLYFPSLKEVELN